jgi:alpha-beta hydrolase superfamily lysophospholipase
MKRPMMDISYMPDDPHSPGYPRSRWAAHFVTFRRIFSALWQAVRKIVRICMYNPLAGFGGSSRFRNEDGTPLGRFIRGLLYRVAFIPIFAALTACAFVYSGTHPRPILSNMDPSSVGIYYEAVNLRTEDNVRLDAWLVPAIEASKVLDKKDKFLRERRPAIILLHDFAERREQMLPLVRPLHDAGFVVLVPALRGCGTSESVGQTFGLHESLDVKACIDLLRKRNFVDPDRVSIIGIGSGANAAMLAAQKDSRVLAMILENPNGDITDLINDYVAPKNQTLAWLRPLCKWAFEIGYEVDAEELNASRDVMKKRQRTVLMLHNASADGFASKEQVEQIRHFLLLRSEEKLLKPMSDVKPLAGAGN